MSDLIVEVARILAVTPHPNADNMERHDPVLGRVILKSISSDYLLRKGGSEHH